MVEAHSAIAGVVRVRREALGLSRAELARRAGVSEAVIQKVEQGTRQPTPTALAALFEALDVPMQYRDHAANVLQPELTDIPYDGEIPDQDELDFLNSLPYPACYQTVPGLDLIAANDAYLQTFPGLTPGVNIIAWMLLDPIARHVMGDWERETHLMVWAFRHMAPGITTPEHIERITGLCRDAPDWQRLWSTDIPPAEIGLRPTRVRSPETGEFTHMQIQLFGCELPRRPWWMYALVPAQAIPA
ncbi:MAG: helix-turn-helix transcriptional regulator [Nocardia sp.]|uniref:helix-turn-helix domain-containing protein n=1 Tax=Nocardia sp. TaxID=1821 RepID=UPI00261D46E7|nr:helix-turn-helix domain-containing protein [Nocardia sp.]MCU1640042.1 helix-turn-helix transcriptional regulator [Nocardia sp.]